MSSSLTRVYRRIVHGPPIVVVSGLPRSGTSMAMKMLEAGGMSPVTDGLRTADDDNPKGYYEYEPVKDLANQEDKSWLKTNARGKVIKIISFLLRELPPNNNYKVVFMLRDLNEICSSQKKMLVNRGEGNESDDARMIELYEDHLWKAKYLLKNKPWFEFLEVPHRQMIKDPATEARRIKEFVDLDLELEKMGRVVDEKLYRNRS